MSKNSKKTTTVNPTGSIGISGGPSATYSNGNSTLKLNAAQQKAYDYAQQSFADNLNSINVFSPEVYNQLKSQVDAYKNNALDQLNDIYTPMLESVRNDSAKRFGNLDNSVFLHNLDSLENKRAKAVSSLAQDVASKQDELIREQLQDRYDYLNFLNSYQNQVLNNALNIASMANSSADLSGKYQLANVQNATKASDAEAQKMAELVNMAAKIAVAFI